MEYSCTHRRLCTDQLTDQLYILYHSRMEKSTVDCQKPEEISLVSSTAFYTSIVIEILETSTMILSQRLTEYCRCCHIVLQQL